MVPHVSHGARLWPLPRAVQLLLVPLLALISAAPITVAGPLVPDALVGSAPAATFQIFGQGYSADGGAFDQTTACGQCWIRVTLTGPGLRVVDGASAEGVVRDLPPGQYELREYRGVFGLHDLGPHDFIVWFEGTGKVIKLS